MSIDALKILSKYMKKIITAILASAIAMSASALIDGDGYYRVQNYMSGRYIYVLDDKGELNFQATTAELGAIQLWKGYERTVSDPSTVIYVKDLDGKGRTFDLQTQGTGVKSMIDYPVTIYLYNKNLGIYSVYGSNSGMVRYIGDATEEDDDRGYVTSNGNSNYHRWYFHPMTADGTNYFGLTPEFQEGNDYFGSLYADFPFSFHSEGMTAYYVSEVGDNYVNLVEIEGVVPRATPIVFKCASQSAADNRLDLGGTATAIDGNLLKGVYFNNTSLLHKNLTPNDPATMRVLGTMSDGSLGFVTSAEKYLPRNKAYVSVPAGSPAEMRITYGTSGIEDAFADCNDVKVIVNGLGVRVEAEGSLKVEVFNVTGQLVAQGVADGSLISLPAAGSYIVNTYGSKPTKIFAH